MSIILVIRPDSDLLNVNATGMFSLKEAKRTFLEILEAVALHKSRKVFFDGRKLIGKPTTIERFFYGEFAAQKVADFEKRGVSPTIKFAYVLRRPMIDPQRFGERVAVHRGMLVKAVESPEEALQWLGIATANKPDPSGI